jgi:Domain of unknown function (DUF4382)
MKHDHALGIAALAAASLLTACSNGGSDPAAATGQGQLSLAVMDAPVDGIAELWVEFTGVQLKPRGSGPAITVDFDAPLQLDLLTLNADNAAMLLNGYTLPAGEYNWIELKVNAEFDGTLDSYAVLQSGGVEEIRVPSGTQNGLRLVSGLTITANQETSLLIDWDARKGVVRPAGQPGFFLRPALRVIDMTQYGTLSGTVAMTNVTDTSCSNDLNLDTGNVVYVFAGADATPDDIDAIDPEPVATIAVKQNNNGDYVYKSILSPGDYTVAFTCQAGSDDPETDDAIVFLSPANATIMDGQEAVIDF